MRLFDEKFGARFLATVPSVPGVYRFLDATGVLLYVGQSANLRRRLGQKEDAGARAELAKAMARVQLAR